MSRSHVALQLHFLCFHPYLLQFPNAILPFRISSPPFLLTIIIFEVSVFLSVGSPSYILNSSLAKSSCFLLLLILTSAWGQEFGIFNPMRSQITRFQVIFDNSLWAEGIPQQNIFSFLSIFGRLNFGWSLSLYHRTLLHIKRRLQHTLIFWSFLHNPYPNVQQAIVLKNSL